MDYWQTQSQHKTTGVLVGGGEVTRHLWFLSTRRRRSRPPSRLLFSIGSDWSRLPYPLSFQKCSTTPTKRLSLVTWRRRLRKGARRRRWISEKPRRRLWRKKTGVYILFENSYTFHNFSLNLPPLKKFLPSGPIFADIFTSVWHFRGQRLEGKRVERLQAQRVER